MAVKKKAAKKPAAKKAPAAKKKVATKKKVVAKKKVAKKKVAAQTAAPAKRKAIADKQTKTQILQAIAEETGLTRKQVGEVFTSLGGLIEGHMKRRGSGEFSIPETGVKIRRVIKPARKARMGRNPATGEEIKIPAKRATTVVKVSALKALKDTIS